jgi:hypothetical protein
MKNRFGDGATVEPHSSTEDANVVVSAQRLQALWRRVERMVADHPKQSIIAALAAGAILGWISKRR